MDLAQIVNEDSTQLVKLNSTQISFIAHSKLKSLSI